MPIAEVVQVITSFLDIIKDVERRCASRADQRLSENQCFAEVKNLEVEFDNFKQARLKLVDKQLAEAEQDLISRGLKNSTIWDGKRRQVEQDAVSDIERAHKALRVAVEKLEHQKLKK